MQRILSRSKTEWSIPTILGPVDPTWSGQSDKTEELRPQSHLQLWLSRGRATKCTPDPSMSYWLGDLSHLCACSVTSVMSNFFATLWTVAHQAPLSIGFLRQEYWSGLPFFSPRDLPDPGIKPRSPVSLAFQVDSLLLSHQEAFFFFNKIKHFQNSIIYVYIFSNFTCLICFAL